MTQHNYTGHLVTCKDGRDTVDFYVSFTTRKSRNGAIAYAKSQIDCTSSATFTAKLHEPDGWSELSSSIDTATTTTEDMDDVEEDDDTEIVEGFPEDFDIIEPYCGGCCKPRSNCTCAEDNAYTETVEELLAYRRAVEAEAIEDSAETTLVIEECCRYCYNRMSNCTCIKQPSIIARMPDKELTQAIDDVMQAIEEDPSCKPVQTTEDAMQVEKTVTQAPWDVQLTTDSHWSVVNTVTQQVYCTEYDKRVADWLCRELNTNTVYTTQYETCDADERARCQHHLSMSVHKHIS